MIDTIILFAAGLGTRMRHMTQELPKPLIQISGKPILHYVFDIVLKYPFKRIIINTHYLHKKLEDEIEVIKNLYPNLPEIIVLYEPSLLDTGGTVKNAYEITKGKAIFTMNSDCLFFSNENFFKKMSDFWDESKMDFLMLSYPIEKAIGYKGKGDYDISSTGKIYRPNNLETMPYMYTGVQILKPSIISQNPKDKFSLGNYYLTDNKFNIYTYQFKGQWCHASCPEDVVSIEDFIKNSNPSYI